MAGAAPRTKDQCSVGREGGRSPEQLYFRAQAEVRVGPRDRTLEQGEMGRN